MLTAKDIGYHYSDEELRKAFAIVENKDNWKNPIDSWIQKRDLQLITEAVEFFTGSTVKTIEDTETHIHIKAGGYYITCGA